MDILDLAEGYYKAVGEKNVSGIEKYLHPQVEFLSPYAKTEGKEAFLERMKGFMAQFKTITIRAKLGSEDQTQAAIIYDTDFPEPIGKVRTAGFLTFEEELIVKIELFFDTSAFG